MPFRLLGLVVDPNRAGELCGHTFAHYAASGAGTTLVCAAARRWPTTEARAASRRLGVSDLVLLDYLENELTAALLEPILSDLINGLRPHVVVADAGHAALRQAASQAFHRVRQAPGGTGALPAKLYYRAAASVAAEITTAVALGTKQPAELFTRVHPSPWVTGVLERDLFAGILADPTVPLAERLAS